MVGTQYKCIAHAFWCALLLVSLVLCMRNCFFGGSASLYESFFALFGMFLACVAWKSQVKYFKIT